MDGVKFEADFTGAFQKTAILKTSPLALKTILSTWGGQAVLALSRRASELQKSGQGKHTSQLARSAGMQVEGKDESLKITIGTGVGKGPSSKYAHIQDEGGTTHPRVTPKSRKFFWFMYYSTKEDKWRGMALTKKATLDVKIPPTLWFTHTMDLQQAMLEPRVTPEAVYKMAEMLAGSSPARAPKGVTI